MHAFRFGLFPFRSPLLWKSMFLSRKKLVSFFSSGYLDVSVHRVPDHTLWIHVWTTEVFSAGFPHSDICGSRLMCSSPQLFAAYHVFLRLLVPRHPPCALVRLTNDLLPTSKSFASSVTLLWFLVCVSLLCFPNLTPFIPDVSVRKLLMLRSNIWPRMSCYISFCKL